MTWALVRIIVDLVNKISNPVDPADGQLPMYVGRVVRARVHPTMTEEGGWPQLGHLRKPRV